MDDLFRLLSRHDVSEVALQTDKPPCARVGAEYVPIRNCKFSEDNVIAALVAASGRAEVLGLMDGPKRWSFEHPLVGTIRVSAAYHGPVLQARFRRDAAAPRPSPRVPAQPALPQNRDAPRDTASPAPRIPISPASAFDPSWSAPPPGRDSAPRNAAVSPAPRDPAASPPDRELPPLPASANPFESDLPPPPEPPSRAGEADFDVALPPIPQPPRGLGSAPGGLFDAPAADPDPAARSEELPLPSAGDVPPSDATSDFVEEATPELDQLLALARARGASDVHVVAERPPLLRIAGELIPVGNAMAASHVEALARRVVPERLEAGLAEHGSCDFAMVHRSLGRFRTNVSRHRTGLKLTARLIGDHVPTLEELGLPASIASATEHHQGLIVVTGPTGHGKTTTLAALVDVINRSRADHVITVEDPVEYIHVRKRAMISQREVGTHTKSFAAALKGALREDPDVIVVGELRDTETVRMALSASETGHLVLATMNTPSAAKTIERIIDLFPPGDQPQVRTSLAGGLRLVVSQRLVPTADRKRVCAAAELLPGSPALWALIRDNKTFQIPSLQQRGKALGIVRFDESLADLVRDGRTSLEIAREFAEAPDQLSALASRPRKVEEPAQAIAAAPDLGGSAQKLGMDVLSRAGRLFGGDKR